MALSLAWLCKDRSVPRGRYWRSNNLYNISLVLAFCSTPVLNNLVVIAAIN